jgi:ABC-type branched-subunit amino acid transport system substrate-binding protein
MKGNNAKLSIAASLGALVGVGARLPLTAGPASAASSRAPITIALVTSESGPAASEFSDAPAGFKARIALQNAEGGVDGHKLVTLVVDDQTTNATPAV